MLPNVSRLPPVWLSWYFLVSGYDVSKSKVPRLTVSLHDLLWCECHVVAHQMSTAIGKMRNVNVTIARSPFGMTLNTNYSIKGTLMCIIETHINMVICYVCCGHVLIRFLLKFANILLRVKPCVCATSDSKIRIHKLRRRAWISLKTSYDKNDWKKRLIHLIIQII